MDAGSRHQNVVLDLRDVRLLDSTGLGQLVQARQLARQKGGDLCLVAPAPFIRTVLGTMKLVPEFRTFAETADALRWLAEARRPAG